MAKHLNPFKRVVARNVIRASEILITVIEPGQAPRIVGEAVSCSFDPQVDTRNVDILGQTGMRHSKLSVSGSAGTLVYKVGTDGSFWAQMWQDVRRGVPREFTLMLEITDPAAPLAGREVTMFEHCNLTNSAGRHTGDASSSSDLQGTLSIWCEDETLVDPFNVIQGTA